VVIAIIAILASLLLPVVNKAKRAGHTARCLSNLHQISLAMHMYTSDNNEKYPYSRDGWPRLPYILVFNQLNPYIATNSVWLCTAERGPFNYLMAPAWGIRSSLSMVAPRILGGNF
jgi:type II secretory pathway pseudopilin PulG